MYVCVSVNSALFLCSKPLSKFSTLKTERNRHNNLFINHSFYTKLFLIIFIIIILVISFILGRIYVYILLWSGGLFSSEG